MIDALISIATAIGLISLITALVFLFAAAVMHLFDKPPEKSDPTLTGLHEFQQDEFVNMREHPILPGEEGVEDLFDDMEYRRH